MKLITLIEALLFFTANGAILPPPWADPTRNKCANQSGGWLLLHWPKDGKCYRIFQRGFPCPETMELSPAQDSKEQIVGECKCPPKTAQTSDSEVCYPIYSSGPCEKGYYFAPIPVVSSKRLGHCLKLEQCGPNEIFWPLTNECFPKFSKGPCPEGQLIVLNEETLIAECHCSNNGPLSKYYWPSTKTCHQYYTKGPCMEKGTLFLPGPTCGCNQFIPNYDQETERCYEIGGLEPCKPGHRFVLDIVTKKATCICKPEHIPWSNGHCYRLYTRGPCKENEILLKNSTCQEIPCSKGKLYFPENNSCHRVGVRGPCAKGQLVLFEKSIKPSVEGISYRGICGCPGYDKCSISEQRAEEEIIKGRNFENVIEEQNIDKELKKNRGTNMTTNLTEIRICEKNEDPKLNSCHLLYTEGPCSKGEWLVPARQGRGEKQVHRFKHKLDDELSIYENEKYKIRVRCDCKPGYTKDSKNGNCRMPLITLAQFLNGKDFFR